MQKKGEATERRGSMLKIPICENPMQLSMYKGHMETVEYIWVNIEKLQKCTLSA